jgi:uncharacterized protein (TIGR02453 family)
MDVMTSPFTPKTLSFLRSLERNNDREWFRARKAEYERHVRGPMIQLIEALAADFPKIAPGFVADPKISLYRIYRDTRFSADKTPLKTHVAAHFPQRGMRRGDGAGLYVEVAVDGVWAGGGIYMPSSADLAAIRAHIAATHPRLHKLATHAAFTGVVGELAGERLTRVPRGYARDHPAARYLQFRQFLGGAGWEPAFATSRRLYPELCKVFSAVAPLAAFLNTALRRHAAPPSLLTSAVPGRVVPGSAIPGSAVPDSAVSDSAVSDSAVPVSGVPTRRPRPAAARRPAPAPMW